MNGQPLRAYHGDPAVKAKYIDRIRAHRAAESLVQGVGWDDSDPSKVRGCAIGCTLENYDHSRYPIELGLPEWLARLEDSIFENVPAAEAQAWPESFLEAIQPGADVEPVRHLLAMRRIDRLIATQRGNLGKHGDDIDAVLNQTLVALEQVRRCHEAEAGGTSCDWSAAWSAAWSARSAGSAAWSAARSAESAESARSVRSAAWSAAESARSVAWSARSAESAAWSAAESARSAESAAWSAAESARSVRSAAWSAAWSAAESARSAAESARSVAWKQEAADLLELLREAAA